MRDITGDLQERANLLEQQINAAQAEFQKLIEHFKGEHDSKLKDLRSNLDAVHIVTGTEDRRFSASKAQPQSGPPQQHTPQQPQPQQPPSNFLLRKMRAISG
jgi:hypothetical protein